MKKRTNFNKFELRAIRTDALHFARGAYINPNGDRGVEVSNQAEFLNFTKKIEAHLKGD